jgi:hypothetical protein
VSEFGGGEVIELIAGWADCAGDSEIDGSGENESLVVVNMFANEIDASGSVSDEGWLCAERLTE